MTDRNIPYDENAVCDKCGKNGAYDFMGDHLCFDCWTLFENEADEKDKTTTKRIKCSCGWIGTEDKLLIGKNPFQPEFTIYGCPKCKEIEDFSDICDEPNCKGMPCVEAMNKGHKLICGKYQPKMSK